MCSSSIEVLEHFSPQSSISSVEVLDRFSRQSSRKHSDDLRSLLQTQLYVQQQQQQHFQQSTDGSNNASLSFDVLAKSSSNSDIEEILDDPLSGEGTVHPHHHHQHIIITETDGKVADASSAVHEAYGLKPKKTLLTGTNLTESSSSGSVTDSVITTYENNKGDPQNPSEQSTSVHSTSTMTSTVSPTKSLNEPDTNKKTKESPLKELLVDSNKTEESSPRFLGKHTRRA